MNAKAAHSSGGMPKLMIPLAAWPAEMRARCLSLRGRRLAPLGAKANIETLFLLRHDLPMRRDSLLARVECDRKDERGSGWPPTTSPIGPQIIG